MGKTLVINGADFSAVSIGRVELPRELSETALAWINASGNSSLTDTQKFAIDDFIEAIGVNKQDSVWSKIGKLWLPLLALDKEHSLVDYKNNYELPVISTGADSFENKVVFRNHGLATTNVLSSDRSPVLDATYSIDTQNCSLFILNTEQYSEVQAGSTKIRGGLGNTGVYKSLHMTQSGTAMIMQCFSSSIKHYDTSSDRFNYKLRGAIGSAGGLKFLQADGTISTESAVASELLTGITILNSTSDRLIPDDDVAKGAFIVGTTMTEQEITTLKTAVETLFAAINV